MARNFESVIISRVESSGHLIQKYDFPVTLSTEYDPQGFIINGYRGKSVLLDTYASVGSCLSKFWQCDISCCRKVAINFHVLEKKNSYLYC